MVTFDFVVVVISAAKYIRKGNCVCEIECAVPPLYEEH